MPAPARAVRRADPRSDPRFKRAIDKLNADSRRLKRHPSPAKKAKEPAAAAKGPANEKAAGARSKQVDKIEQAETPKPQPASFLALLQAEIEKAMPKTLGDTEKFMKGGSAEQMKGSLKGNVAQQKQQATGDLKKNTGQSPSEAGVPAKPVTPIPAEPATPAPQVPAAEAMPAPKSDAEISLQASKGDVQAELQKEKLTDERLTKANDPRFSAVLTAKDAVGKQADAGPAKYRAKEAGTLAASAAKAVDVAKRGSAALVGAKGGNKAKILSRQEQQKVKEEQELKVFSDFVVVTFERTKRAVDKRLELLETKVNDMFDRGVESALGDMKSFVENQLFDYKVRRYLSIPLVGQARWIRDQFRNLPEEANRFYEAGRARFTRSMNALAVQVANLVESQLAAAKNDVKIAQAQIAAKQATLSPGVTMRAAQVQAEFAGKFAELESSIEDKKQQLAEGLAQKYKEAFDKADEALKAIQDENKGLVVKAKEKIGEIIKALIEFKNRLMAILRKAADSIELILAHPGQFLSNLLAAIKQGFQRFKDNIWKHLKDGFAKWLFGALAGTGIEIPTDLTLPSILKLVLGVLGITYERMKAKAVKLLGPTAVAVIEKLVSYLQTLIGGGPAALWEQIKGDLSNLKEMVIDAIQDWLITTIVKRAVAKIVSMFNPVGAIVQIIMMIISIVKFVIERAAQILDFVEAVVNSIAAIASGAIDTAAGWIERSLANMVPLLIGFLASLLGVGGISDKIRETIKKVQVRVDKAIDKVINKAVGWVKGLFGKGKKDGKPDERSDDQKKAVVEKAVADADALLSDEKLSGGDVAKKLPNIQSRYKLTSLSLISDNKTHEEETFHIEGVINPDKKSKPKKKPVKDGTTKISISRSKFTVTTKWDLMYEDPSQHKKLVTGRAPRLKKSLDRRHVISSHTMAAHYEQVLNGKKWSEASKLLADHNEEVTPPLSSKKIQKVVQARHKAFFNDICNLFIGDASENRSIGAETDIPADWASLEWKKHLRYIKKHYALSSAFTA